MFSYCFDPHFFSWIHYSRLVFMFGQHSASETISYLYWRATVRTIDNCKATIRMSWWWHFTNTVLKQSLQLNVIWPLKYFVQSLLGALLCTTAASDKPRYSSCWMLLLLSRFWLTRWLKQDMNVWATKSKGIDSSIPTSPWCEFVNNLFDISMINYS